MMWIRLTCAFVFVFSGLTVFAQENEVKQSSATDAKVKIHEGKRVRATAPPKKFRARFNEKSKKVVNVKEETPKVQKTSIRRQKRNNRLRRDGH